MNKKKSVLGESQKNKFRNGNTKDKKFQSLMSIFTKRETNGNSVRSEESDDDETLFQNLKRRMGRSSWTMYPDLYFKEVWDWFLAMLIVFESIAVPFFIVYDIHDDRFVKIIEGMIEVLFVIDSSKFL